MKVTLKRVPFTKTGKCRGVVKKKGRSRRRVCYISMGSRHRSRRR